MRISMTPWVKVAARVPFSTSGDLRMCTGIRGSRARNSRQANSTQSAPDRSSIVVARPPRVGARGAQQADSGAHQQGRAQDVDRARPLVSRQPLERELADPEGQQAQRRT